MAGRPPRTTTRKAKGRGEMHHTTKLRDSSDAREPPASDSGLGKIKWSRMQQKTREWTRRARRSESLKHDDWVVRLDDYEAAEYLGLPVRRFRRLVEKGVLRFYPGTRLFDVDELQEYVLAL